jgi:hypothetical protein
VNRVDLLMERLAAWEDVRRALEALRIATDTLAEIADRKEPKARELAAGAIKRMEEALES